MKQEKWKPKKHVFTSIWGLLKRYKKNGKNTFVCYENIHGCLGKYCKCGIFWNEMTSFLTFLWQIKEVKMQWYNGERARFCDYVLLFYWSWFRRYFHLCFEKRKETIEAEVCPYLIYMLARILSKYSVSEIMGYLKGISLLMIFEKHVNLKYKYGNRYFWCRGYYVDTVGKNTAAIKAYIQKQLQEDLEYDQMSLVEYIDPFTGEPVKKNKK